MRRCLIIASVAIFGILVSAAQTPLTFEMGAAWANGGRDSITIEIANDPPSGTTSKKKKKRQISIANDYPQSKYREIRDFQSWISTHAKKDKLGWIATNEGPLKKFVTTYEKFKNKYRGLKALEVNKIFTQLKKYARQKKDPKLAEYAKGMLRSFTVYDHLRYARGKYAEWKKAPKGIKKELAKRDYEEAQDGYYKARSKLPRRMVTSFPVIKDIR